MIKDKITPVLKNRFRKEIRITMDTGKERGFFICEDEKGQLVPSKTTCEGNECEIRLKDPKGACAVKLQGDFHTHAYLASAKRMAEERGKEIPPDMVLKNIVTQALIATHEERGGKGLSAVIPSYTDLLRSVLVSCGSDIEGTSCVGSDLDDSQVECWTPKKDIKLIDCEKAEKEYSIVKGKHFSPMRWVIDLFDRETIYLK